ncbi:MAG: dTMP kinase [Actinomyces sp.]|nr:MAG: dTMP kinase [Actinomyces sp.]
MNGPAAAPAGRRRGRLIAFEGADGAGKSTQAHLLARRLDALETFQFGATRVGAAIRDIVLDPDRVELDDRAEALLIAADKAQHVAEIVRPALEAGRDVVTDRFTASSLAYQGHGRGLDLARLAAVIEFATGGLEPDLVVLLDIEPAAVRDRLGEADRIEAAGGAFHERVRAGYLALAAADPQRWVVIDARGAVEEVAARVWDAVRGRLGS